MKVLEVINGSRIYGGAELFAIKSVENMNREDLQIDFLSMSPVGDEFRERIEKTGICLHRMDKPSGKKRVQLLFPIIRFLKDHRYDVVHAHLPTGLIIAVWTVAARLARVKKLIIHVHCARVNESVAVHLLKLWICSLVSLGQKIVYCACSIEAAEWNFGKRKAKKTLIVKSGIDAEKFNYKEDIRKTMRDKLHISESDYVIGHVGRFSPEKNHSFILEVFALIAAREPSARLMLIGDGPLMTSVKQIVKEKELDGKVLLIGVVDNVQDYYQAMDVFLFPSINEGFGMAAIEAQAAGLPIVVSSSVPHDIKLTESVLFLPLEESAEAWADLVLSFRKHRRTGHVQEIREAGYDIVAVSEEIRALYIQP